MSISSKPTRFLYFEVARLRTLFDKRPEIRDGIIKRYQEVVKELDSRGAKFFWNPHPIDQFMDLKKAFIRPNKPAWRIFTPEEVFGISGFELPVLVDIKIDGMRLQIHNDNGVQIYSEDEGLNKTHKFKEPLEDIKKIPEGTILDTEGVLVTDGQVLHRTSFIGYVNGKGFDEEKDKQAEFWVFDVPKWGNKDLTDEPLSVRLSYLKKIPECKHLKIFKVGEEAFICKTREEVLSAIKRVAGKKGSEGAMIKVLSSKYVKDVHNKGWIKLKNLKEVDCLVVEIEQPKHQKGPLEGKPVEGVYNYHVAAGPYSETDGKVLLDEVPTKVRDRGGKVYAYLGKTFNTEIKVKVGDIIRIWSPEINKYQVKQSNLFTYGIYEPRVLEWVHERNIPDSLNVLNRLVEETSGQHPRAVKGVEGSTLADYEALAKPGEPLPDKYYKFHSGVKDPKFVLQRHYPIGEKVPIKPGEEVPQMHKGFVVEYDEKHPEAFRNFMADLMDQFEELEADERVKIEKSSFGILFSNLITKMRDHLDLRLEISDTVLVGVTIHPPVPGGITAWDAFKSRMEGEEKTQVTPKYEHPHQWLTREGELRFPTRHENQPEQTAHYLEVARMDILDSGSVRFGVQREDLHEFFFHGKTLKGRWVIRKLKIGTEAAHWTWLLMKPSDQRPLDPVLHRDSGYIKIDRVSQPTTEEREAIEEETRSAREERGQAV